MTVKASTTDDLNKFCMVADGIRELQQEILFLQEKCKGYEGVISQLEERLNAADILSCWLGGEQQRALVRDLEGGLKNQNTT